MGGLVPNLVSWSECTGASRVSTAPSYKSAACLCFWVHRCKIAFSISDARMQGGIPSEVTAQEVIDHCDGGQSTYTLVNTAGLHAVEEDVQGQLNVALTIVAHVLPPICTASCVPALLTTTAEGRGSQLCATQQRDGCVVCEAFLHCNSLPRIHTAQPRVLSVCYNADVASEHPFRARSASPAMCGMITSVAAAQAANFQHNTQTQSCNMVL